MTHSEEELKDFLVQRTQQMLHAVAEDAMTRDVLSVDVKDLCAKAARLILENGVLGVLVMKDGRAFNVVSSSDLLRLSYNEVFDENRDFLRLSVGELVADKEFISVPSGTRLSEILNIMVDRGMRSVPIIDSGLVRGIVSMTDLIRWYRNTHEEVRTGKLS